MHVLLFGRWARCAFKPEVVDESRNAVVVPEVGNVDPGYSGERQRLLRQFQREFVRLLCWVCRCRDTIDGFLRY